MSKHRPSDNPRSNGSAPVPGFDRDAWLKRLFHNTYTRKGRRREVRGWAVKIQVRGRRRTLSLTKTSRQAAAAEAYRLHQEIVARGWDAVLQSRLGRAVSANPEPPLEYWLKRLVPRREPPDPEGAPVLSAWIEHAGAGYYFPLRRRTVDEAAERAWTIQRTVIDRGWADSLPRFSREATLSFIWRYNPYLCTYTTVHTQAADESATESPAVKASKWKVWIAEADPELRRALTRWLPEASGNPALPLEEQLRVPAPTAANGLVLAIVNRELAEKLKLPTADELTVLPGGLPVLPYSVYPSSEELFRLCPGRLFSYTFKRLRPQAMLEPVHDHFGSGFAALGKLEQSAQAFFHSLLETPQPPPPARLPDTLTQRERDVLVLLSRGCVDKEIARLLGISSWTVHEHVKRIFDKLHVHSRVEAALAYLQK